MKAPSQQDRFVKVRAYLSDRDFGYENWHARQFASPEESRPAVLILCHDETEQAQALAYLTDRETRHASYDLVSRAVDLSQRFDLSLRLGQILGPEYDGVPLEEVARELVRLKAERQESK